MSQLLAPGGRLICLEFPSNKDPKIGGPPFGVPEAVYKQHLGQPGVDIPYTADGFVKEDITLPETPASLTRIARWQPERTHEIGKGQDWISIWKH